MTYHSLLFELENELCQWQFLVQEIISNYLINKSNIEWVMVVYLRVCFSIVTETLETTGDSTNSIPLVDR